MDNPTPGSRPFEVVPSDQSRVKLADERRVPRLILTTEQFRVKGRDKLFSVVDLSKEGMGLWLSDYLDVQFFSVGLFIEGILNLKGEKLSVSARVRNLTRNRVGCEFESISQGTSLALSLFLKPEVLGAQLKPVPSSGLNTLWYHGPSGTDLLLHRLPDGVYDQLMLCVLGSFVEWDRIQGLSTGNALPTTNESEVRGIFRYETLSLARDSRPDPLKLNVAKTVILSSKLPQELKSWCLRQFER